VAHALPADGDTRGVQVIVIEHLSPASVLPPAPIDGDAAAAIDGVDRRRDDRRRRGGHRAHRDRLGIRLAFDRTFEQRGLRLLFFRVAGITVELAAPLGAAATPDRFWASRTASATSRRRRARLRRRLRRVGGAQRPQAGHARLHRAQRDPRRRDAADRGGEENRSDL
jgi:hypothetical protein